MATETRIMAPPFADSLKWLNVDHPLTLEQLRGRIVLLNFTTYSSINCQHVLPDLRYLEKRFQDAIVVIDIHSPKFRNEADEDQLKKAIGRLHIRRPVASDAQFEMWRSYGIKAWPSVIFVDAEGYVVGVLRGEGRVRQLEELIQKYVAQAELVGLLRRQKPPVATLTEPSSNLRFPGRICVSRNHLYIADSGRNRILETYHDGTTRRVFGSGSASLLDGPEEGCSFNSPQGIIHVGDFLYVADTGNHVIRRIHLKSGEVMTLAGTGEHGRYVADRFKDPLQAKLNSPMDLTFHESNLYIAMTGQHQIWRMNLNHLTIERFAGSGREDLVDGAGEQACFSQPSGITVANDRLFVADANASAIRAITLNHNVTDTLIGKGVFDFGDREGVGQEARLQYPLAVEADPERNALWIADTYNSRIKRLDLGSNQVTKFKFGHPLNEPGGLALFRNKLYIANTNAHEIVSLDLQSRLVEVVEIKERVAEF